MYQFIIRILFISVLFTLLNIISVKNVYALIQPVKAWIVYTEEAEGGVKKQSIISDKTETIVKKDNIFVCVKEIKNPLNVSNRTELYVLFAAEKIDGLPGYYIIVCNPKPHLGENIAYFELDYIHLIKEEQLFLAMSARTNSVINIWFYYSLDPRIYQAWDLSDVDGGVLNKTELINAVRFTNRFVDNTSEAYADNRIHDIRLHVDPFITKQGKAIDLSLGLLQSLDKVLSAEEQVMTWKKDLLKSEKIEEILADYSIVQKEKEITADYYIRIRFDTQLINIGSPMVSNLDRIIAVQTGPHQYIPGSIVIGIDLH